MIIIGMKQKIENLGDTGVDCLNKILQNICLDNQVDKPVYSELKHQYAITDDISSFSDESTKTFAKSTIKLIQSPSDAILEKVPTVSSTESIGETIENPNFKLRNKFNDIQLSQFDREEIYSYLCTLNHIESNQYKIQKYTL